MSGRDKPHILVPRHSTWDDLKTHIQDMLVYSAQRGVKATKDEIKREIQNLLPVLMQVHSLEWRFRIKNGRPQAILALTVEGPHLETREIPVDFDALELDAAERAAIIAEIELNGEVQEAE